MTREMVTTVIDGDTFHTATQRVRLAHVNASEIGESGSVRATNKLRSLIDGKFVSIDQKSISYGRAVAEVKVGDLSVNDEMRKFLGN